MGYTYAQRKRAAGAKSGAITEGAAQPRMEALQSGAVKPSAAEMGHRVDLPEAMRARMESSFGADLSAVKLYESQTVADAGANAVAQGNNIAFAPGKLDFSSFGAQALLGHELSHVVSQQRGEVTGGGFLNDHALEARADREGAMAARGESVYGGASVPLSAASAAPAAGPMQAERDSTVKKEQAELAELTQRRESEDTDYVGRSRGLTQKGEKRFQKLNAKQWAREKKTMSPGEYYDRIALTLSSDPDNDKGYIPKSALKWYQKHKKKGSRTSGKKGWDSPQDDTSIEKKLKKMSGTEDEWYI